MWRKRRFNKKASCATTFSANDRHNSRFPPHMGQFNFRLLIVAEILCVHGPFSIPGRNQIRYHAAHIFLLCRIVVRSCVISGNCHRPGFMPVVQIFKEHRRIFHVALRVKHFLRGTEIFSVEVLIDLHATEIDQLRTVAFRLVKSDQSLIARRGKH